MNKFDDSLLLNGVSLKELSFWFTNWILEGVIVSFEVLEVGEELSIRFWISELTESNSLILSWTALFNLSLVSIAE